MIAEGLRKPRNFFERPGILRYPEILGYFKRERCMDVMDACKEGVLPMHRRGKLKLWQLGHYMTGCRGR